MNIDYRLLRKRMVEDQLKSRGITDDKVLWVMSSVSREAFVQGASQHMAYHDFPLPIGKGQTMSQPYMVALMTQLLELTGSEKVLEVGTGCGYQACILSKLSRKVISVEVDKELAAKAQKNLLMQNCSNVKVIIEDGSLGFIYGAPYDAIMVTAGAPKIPQKLLEQLKIGGKMVIPVGQRAQQTLLVITKKRKGQDIVYEEKSSVNCLFVPLKGKYGW